MPKKITRFFQGPNSCACTVPCPLVQPFSSSYYHIHPTQKKRRIVTSDESDIPKSILVKPFIDSLRQPDCGQLTNEAHDAFVRELVGMVLLLKLLASI